MFGKFKIHALRGIKKLIAFAIIVSTVLTNITVLADNPLIDGKKYDWYFIPASDNKQPRFDVNLDELKKYDAYAIGNPDDKVLYLTFDFGYENGNVKKCLDTLNKYQVKASFFVTGNSVKRNAELVKEIMETGHIVGNHTVRHANMPSLKSSGAYDDEVIGLENMYEEFTGYKLSKYLRPPEGSYTKQNLEYNKKLGYKTIFWSVAYMDWDENNQPSKDYATRRLLNLTHNGAIMLIHPTSSTNAAILGTLIETWQEQGYRFATLDEFDYSGDSTPHEVSTPAVSPAPQTQTPPVASDSNRTSQSQRKAVAAGNVLNSDIMAYINGNAIPSLSVNDKTVVSAEDLARYGFDVVWNERDKTLRIAYNAAKKSTPIKTAKNAKKSGSIYCKYFASDIRTYIAGKEVRSYNIGGITLVNIEDLSAAYGTAVWDAAKREIRIDVKGQKSK